MSAGPADLIADYNKLTAFIEAENKRFDEHMKPARTRVEEIKNSLLALMNEQRVESFKTEEGTAYKSVITTPKITDKTQFLDWCLEEWDSRGAMLQIGAPQKDALNEFMDVNDGGLPPFVEISSFARVNIRRG